jgi:hypothetical protein
MKTQLGKRLLAELMGWDDAQATVEFAWLQTMVEYKYDHYQGYSPGSRFFVNLLSWLSQFAPADRSTAYDLIRTKLVFISQREMHHLVGLSLPRLHRDNRRAVADQLGVPMCATWGNPAAEKRLTEINRRTVYIGLSDGARTDVLRRLNEGVISNEQIVAATEISEKKWDKLRDGLADRLKKEHLDGVPALFERICLVDDFTASGSSLIRKDKGQWKGKVPTFISQMSDQPDQKRFGTHVTEDCVVQIHHYIGTDKSKRAIDDLLDEYKLELGELDISFNATYSMVLHKSIVIEDTSDARLVDFLRQYYSASCEDEHTGKDIWFGYKDCGLPLILDHNTPNNSIALLWAASAKSADAAVHEMKPLFPRKKRHVEHGQSI